MVVLMGVRVKTTIPIIGALNNYKPMRIKQKTQDERQEIKKGNTRIDSYQFIALTKFLD